MAPAGPAYVVVPVRKRLDEIDIAKGIGIILVVLGHIVAVRSEGPVAYAIFKTYLYQFHMPFFMYLSGFAFWRACERYSDVGLLKYTLARADRLLVPFFVFGLIIIVAKAAAKSLMYVDDAPDQIWTGLSSLFIHTDDSPALSIWYVFVLFVYSVFSFATKAYKNNVLPITFAFSAAIYTFDFADFLYMNRISAYYIFFVIGMFISSRYEIYQNYIRDKFFLYLSVFTLVSVTLVYLNETNKITVMAASLAAIPFLHSASMVATRKVAEILRFFGKNSFAIYLMNTIAIGVVKAAYVRLLFEMNGVFLLYALLATVAGLLLPVLVSAVLKNRATTLSKYVT